MDLLLTTLELQLESTNHNIKMKAKQEGLQLICERNDVNSLIHVLNKEKKKSW